MTRLAVLLAAAGGVLMQGTSCGVMSQGEGFVGLVLIVVAAVLAVAADRISERLAKEKGLI